MIEISTLEICVCPSRARALETLELFHSLVVKCPAKPKGSAQLNWSTAVLRRKVGQVTHAHQFEICLSASQKAVSRDVLWNSPVESALPESVNVKKLMSESERQMKRCQNWYGEATDKS